MSGGTSCWYAASWGQWATGPHFTLPNTLPSDIQPGWWQWALCCKMSFQGLVVLVVYVLSGMLHRVPGFFVDFLKLFLILSYLYKLVIVVENLLSGVLCGAPGFFDSFWSFFPTLSYLDKSAVSLYRVPGIFFDNFQKFFQPCSIWINWSFFCMYSLACFIHKLATSFADFQLFLAFDFWHLSLPLLILNCLCYECFEPWT